MHNIKPLLFFVGKFFLIYIALIVAVHTTGFTNAYRNAFVSASSVFYKNIYENANVKCEAISNANGDDLSFTFANEQDIAKAKAAARQGGSTQTTIKGFKWSFNVYRVDLMFVLFLLALVMAYPSGWKKKLVGLLICGAVYYLLSFSLLGGRMLYQFHQNQSVFPEYTLSNVAAQALSTATNMHTEGMFFVVLLIWAVVMIRKRDLAFLG